MQTLILSIETNRTRLEIQPRTRKHHLMMHANGNVVASLLPVTALDDEPIDGLAHIFERRRHTSKT